MTELMRGPVNAATVVFTLCLICNVWFWAVVASCFCPSLPNKVSRLTKDARGPRCTLTIISCPLPRWPTSTVLHCLFRLPPSVCHSPSNYLIPNSTFHQLLVSPNSCHLDAGGLGTFPSHTLHMWLIRKEGGVGVGEVTGFGIKLLHLPAFQLMSCWQDDALQGGHKCIMALRSARLRQTQGVSQYMVDISWDKVRNTINNSRGFMWSHSTSDYTYYHTATVQWRKLVPSGLEIHRIA